jgi:hypothetical protein
MCLRVTTDVSALVDYRPATTVHAGVRLERGRDRREDWRSGVLRPHCSESKAKGTRTAYRPSHCPSLAGHAPDGGTDRRSAVSEANAPPDRTSARSGPGAEARRGGCRPSPAVKVGRSPFPRCARKRPLLTAFSDLPRRRIVIRSGKTRAAAILGRGRKAGISVPMPAAMSHGAGGTTSSLSAP